MKIEIKSLTIGGIEEWGVNWDDPVEKRNALTQLRKDIFLQLEDLIPCRYLDIEGIEVHNE